MDCNPCD
jgi:hypothetical protein